MMHAKHGMNAMHDACDEITLVRAEEARESDYRSVWETDRVPTKGR
jgi:hypothetical protein